MWLTAFFSTTQYPGNVGDSLALLNSRNKPVRSDWPSANGLGCRNHYDNQTDSDIAK